MYRYCLYIGTSHSMSLYQYVTDTALVLPFIYVLVLWVLLVHWYQPLYVSVPICYWYRTGTAVYMYWYCGYCWYIGTLVPATLCLCAYMLLVPHWYCSLYVLVLWVLLVHWCQPLDVSVPICYLYRTGTAVYMYWYCGYCCYIGTSHSMSLYQYVTGTALVLLFICTYTVGTVGTLFPATLSLCLYVTGTTLVLLFICTGTVDTVGTLVPTTLCLCTNMYWYCGYCGYCGYGWYIGTSHSMSLYQYVTGTALVLLFICTGTAVYMYWYCGTLVPVTLCLCTNMLLVLHWYCCLYVLILLVHWYQQLYVSVPICYWYHIGTAVYMYWYC